MPRVAVNEAELYHEVRGAGPAVLFIMGATGDGGHFDAVADLLADEFTVITYDRRGNGRSPVPAGWQTTSPEEQADDAVALLKVLGVGPVAVFALVEEAMAAGGPATAVERFWEYVAGDGAWDQLPPALRERMRERATTLFGVELGTYERYLPDDRTLAALGVPVRLLVSEDSLPVFAEIAGRLGPRLGVDVATTPGSHAAYHDHPSELAEAIRPFLREVSGAGPTLVP